MEPTENDALDAYSQVVSGVAELLLPRVAAIRSGAAAGPGGVRVRRGPHR